MTFKKRWDNENDANDDEADAEEEEIDKKSNDNDDEDGYIFTIYLCQNY